MDALDELEALRGNNAEAEERVREVEAGHRAAQAELKRARTNLAEVEADGTPKEIEAAREQLEKARRDAEVEMWRERLRVARGRRGASDQAVRRFIAGSIRALDDELGETECDPARDRVNQTAQALLDALCDYDQVRGEYIATMHLGLDGAGRWVPAPRAAMRLAVEQLLSEGGEVSPRINWSTVPEHFIPAGEAREAQVA